MSAWGRSTDPGEIDRRHDLLYIPLCNDQRSEFKYEFRENQRRHRLFRRRERY